MFLGRVGWMGWLGVLIRWPAGPYCIAQCGPGLGPVLQYAVRARPVARTAVRCTGRARGPYCSTQYGPGLGPVLQYAVRPGPGARTAVRSTGRAWGSHQPTNQPASRLSDQTAQPSPARHNHKTPNLASRTANQAGSQTHPTTQPNRPNRPGPTRPTTRNQPTDQPSTLNQPMVRRSLKCCWLMYRPNAG